MRRNLAVVCFVLGVIGLALPALAQTPEPSPVARLIMFHSPTCPHCRDVIENVLPELQARYGDELEMHLLDLSVRESYLLFSALHTEYPELPTGVPQGLIGSTFLIGSDQFANDLPVAIEACLAQGGCEWPFDVEDALVQLGVAAVAEAAGAESDIAEEAVTKLDEATLESTASEMSARFAGFSIPAVAVAGLLDGVNPCAFATILFFVSYLTIAGRVRRDILLVGGAFTAAIFLTYLLLGLGLSAVIEQLGVASLVARLIYLVTAIVCLVLAVISLWDFRMIRQGRLEDISLQLPKWLKLRIHRTIREGSRSRRYVWAAFGAGIAVSIFELACTGQVYLPTIVYMTSVSESRLPAFGYLTLYNMMFVVPLIAVFLVAYFGTSSQRMTHFFRARAGSIKLLTAALFAVLGVWLLSVVLN